MAKKCLICDEDVQGKTSSEFNYHFDCYLKRFAGKTDEASSL